MVPLASSQPASDRLRRLLTLGALALAAALGGAALIALLTDPTADLTTPSWAAPFLEHDTVAYPSHAALGSALNRLGGPPRAAAAHWVKAAAHARSQADIRRAADGIAAARGRGDDHPSVDASLCRMAARGSPTVQVAVALGGARCAADSFVRVHVPHGTLIDYGARPPIGGPHYNGWYPSYGVAEQPVPAGLWVHNLEHGAIVLLYRCENGCADLVARLRAFHAALPKGRNARSGAARLLATPYAEMDHRIAVIAWGQLLELDDFDPERVEAFYLEHLDRGPECRALACPE
jgi:uncharacterized protein DUF3105